MTATEVMDQLISLGPVVSVLISIIYYLNKKLKKTEAKIDELNKNTRDNDKENILLLESLSHALDKLSERETNSTSMITAELRNMRDLILSKLEK